MFDWPIRIMQIRCFHRRPALKGLYPFVGFQYVFRLLAFSVILASLTGCGEDLVEEPVAKPETDTGNLTVKTLQGVVKGSFDKGVRQWKGIPYARPPVGELRWRSPRPPKTMDEPLQADTFGDVCVQPPHPFGSPPPEVAEQKVWGSEDCLYLNVYAPPNAENLPVMFWIHGGSHVVGSGHQYDGSLLASSQQVVVVTHNYRLGPFGWWYYPSGDPDPRDASGNFALLDHLQALAWVRENIVGFGGNPRNVTLFGESAGAVSVAALVASPYGRGFFHAAIMQSGSIALGASTATASNYSDDLREPGSDFSSREILLRFVTSSENPEEEEECDRSCALVRLAGLSPSRQLELARSIPAETLVDLYGDTLNLLIRMPKVILDGNILPRKGLRKALRDRETGSLVPVILGSNKDEAKLFMAVDPNHVFSVANIPVWRWNADEYEREAKYRSLVWRLYGVDIPATELVNARVPVWSYRFDWDDLVDSPFVDFTKLFGAAHAFEVPFVFGDFSLFGPLSRVIANEDNQPAREMLSNRMMAYWGAFAHNKDPGKGRDGEGVEWERFRPNRGVSFMHLDTDGDKLATRMSDESPLTLESLLDTLASDEDIDEDERCLLFETWFSPILTASELEQGAQRVGCQEGLVQLSGE